MQNEASYARKRCECVYHVHCLGVKDKPTKQGQQEFHPLCFTCLMAEEYPHLAKKRRTEEEEDLQEQQK